MKTNKLYHQHLPDFLNSFFAYYELLLHKKELELMANQFEGKVENLDKFHIKEEIKKCYAKGETFSFGLNLKQSFATSLEIAFVSFINSLGYYEYGVADKKLHVFEGLLGNSTTFYNFDVNFIHNSIYDIGIGLAEGNSHLISKLDEEKALTNPMEYLIYLSIAGIETAAENTLRSGLVALGLKHRITTYELMSYIASVDLYNLDTAENLTSVSYFNKVDVNNVFLNAILGKTREEVRESFKALSGENGGCPLTHLPSSETKQHLKNNGYLFSHTAIASLSYHLDKFILDIVFPALNELAEENTEILEKTIPNQELLLLRAQSSIIDKELFSKRGMIEEYEKELLRGNINRERISQRYENQTIFSEDLH